MKKTKDAVTIKRFKPVNTRLEQRQLDIARVIIEKWPAV